jgi:general stress protein 26
VVDDARRHRVQPADRDEQRTLWKRVAGERVAMLSTHDPGRTIVTRPVMPAKVEPEGRVWIFTAIGGGIADDIRRDGRVHHGVGARPAAGRRGDAPSLHEVSKACG